MKNALERLFVCEQLDAIGLGYFPSETNFVYVYTDQSVTAKLISNGIVVRQMKLTGFADAFRITLGTREDNEFFLETLKEIVREKAV